MFKRFQKAGYPVQMLKTQYRMHPQVLMSLSSHMFLCLQDLGFMTIIPLPFYERHHIKSFSLFLH